MTLPDDEHLGAVLSDVASRRGAVRDVGTGDTGCESRLVCADVPTGELAVSLVHVLTQDSN